jgi:hypothetical protein
MIAGQERQNLPVSLYKNMYLIILILKILSRGFF